VQSMLIAVPSKGRAGKTPTTKLLGEAATLFVPASEFEQYKKCSKGEKVVAVPNDVRGITPTRNWIIDYSQSNRIVMIDDDVKAQGFMQLNAFNAKHKKMTSQEWLIEWEKLFEVAEDMQYRIWGVSTDGALRSVYPWSPFLWQSYVTASCMGLRKETGIRFDESYPVKEDYEICLRCIAEDGGVVAARYLYWANSHWVDDGGCKDYRTATMEKRMIDKLLKQYPGLIRSVTRANGASEYSIQLEF